MAILMATCATFASVIAAAQPGDTVHLPLQPARCGYVRLHNANKPAPGVVVRIDPRQRIGLHMTNSSGLLFDGGWWEGAGSDPRRSGEAGIYVRNSRSFAFRNGTFGHRESNTVSGVRILNSTDFEIASIKIAWRTSDAIALSDVERFRILDSVLTDQGARHATCTSPDGTVTLHTPRARCEQQGGVWVDSSHPDAVQFWGFVRDGLIARNKVFGAQSGIVNFGPRHADSARVWVLDNVVRTNVYPQGIASGPQGSLIRGNQIGWPASGPAGEGWGTMINAYPGTVACENVRLAGGGFHPWGSPWDQSCSKVTLPPAPAAPIGVPPRLDPTHLQLVRMPAPF